jgi:TolB-like protein
MAESSNFGSSTDGQPRWWLRLLGGFAVAGGPGGERPALSGKRERALLAYLALSPGCRTSRRKLAFLLWGDATDETALDNLRTSVWRLRRALGDAEHRVITSDGEDIVLNAGLFDIDALAFLHLSAQSNRSDLEAAATLYGGEFLSGLVIESEEFESWQRAEAERCRNQAIDVLGRLIAQQDACGDIDRAIETGIRLLGLDPLHEAAARRLMRLYGQSGRRGAALQVYRSLVGTLQTELDAEPEPETKLVFTEIARGADEQAPPATSSRGQPAPGISIAVLPFANMSGDAAQEFFSDGMTEEITAALAKIPTLRVVARTSAFQFKGQNVDVRIVGQSLNANYLIEGAVRKADDRVRITAKLIRTQDGTHVWSDHYDRQLPDVFAIQESIAQAIAHSLHVPLGLREGQTLVSSRTSDTESYQDYLRAKALVRTRGALEPGGSLTEAVKLLGRVVVRDPNYAPAWGLLGQAHSLIPTFSAALVNGATDELRRVSKDSLQSADATAQQATRLDHNVDGYTALAFVRNYCGGFIQADALFKHALALDPGNPEALHQYSLMLAGVGMLKAALPLRLRLQAQEPLVPIFNRATAEVLWLNGRNDEAIAILKDLPPAFGPRLRLAEVYASTGRYDDAADALEDLPSGIFPKEMATEAVRLLRRAPKHARVTNRTLNATRLGFVHLYAGSPDRVLDFFEALAETGYPGLGNATCRLWAPSYAPVRRSDRFKAFVRKAGMVDFWRSYGWPDQCRVTGPDDFVCV